MMLHLKSENRPEAEEILNLPWIQVSLIFHYEIFRPFRDFRTRKNFVCLRMNEISMFLTLSNIFISLIKGCGIFLKSFNRSIIVFHFEFQGMLVKCNFYKNQNRLMQIKNMRKECWFHFSI